MRFHLSHPWVLTMKDTVWYVDLDDSQGRIRQDLRATNIRTIVVRDNGQNKVDQDFVPNP